MSLRDVAMNNFERDQARGEWESESIGCYQSTDYSAMKEVKSGATKYPASLTYIPYENNRVTRTIGVTRTIASL